MANKYVPNRYTVLVNQDMTPPPRRSPNWLIPSVVIVTMMGIAFAFRSPLAAVLRSILS